MMFQLISEDTLKATLTAQDVGMLGLTFEEKDPAALRRLRLALMTLLAEAQASIGFLPETGHLAIELYPEDDGGCIVLFRRDAALPDQSVYCPLVFRFNDAETLIEASVRLFALHGHRLFGSSLYRLDGTYRLIVRPIDGETGAAAKLLSEYGLREANGFVAAALIEEHGRPILTEHAVDTLSYYFDR